MLCGTNISSSILTFAKLLCAPLRVTKYNFANGIVIFMIAVICSAFSWSGGQCGQMCIASQVSVTIKCLHMLVADGRKSIIGYKNVNHNDLESISNHLPF